jgi:predicted Zn-dependent peptidase
MKLLGRLLTALAVMLPLISAADTYQELEEKVVEHELENGMRFLIVERHDAPLVGMYIAVQTGSVNEVTNKTGLAHFLEHLAFKGTKTIGTSNYKAEQKAMEELDQAFEIYHNAQQTGADSATIAQYFAEFKEAQDVASSYVVPGGFSQIYERNGGRNLNAATSYDLTTYVVVLPSNRFELWCAMESDRLANPVFRELYKERDVILEERRMRTDNSPSGLFYEEFNSISCKAHPYGQPIIGHYSDMQNLTRADVRDFYQTYYVPQHITAAIVGDVDADQAISLIETYFGKIPARPDPPPLITTEPEQPGVRRVEMHVGQRPRLLMSFPTVPAGHPDETAVDMLANALGSSQTSRLYRSLVEDRKIANYIYCCQSNQLYGGGLVFSGTPAPGVTAGELEEALLEELAMLAENPITEQELDAARARLEVRAYSGISWNTALAYYLATNDQGHGGWRRTFTYVRDVKDVTPEDVERVVEAYIDFDKRTVGLMEAEND